MLYKFFLCENYFNWFINCLIKSRLYFCFTENSEIKRNKTFVHIKKVDEKLLFFHFNINVYLFVNYSIVARIKEL
jgi:hypothetical protein